MSNSDAAHNKANDSRMSAVTRIFEDQNTNGLLLRLTLLLLIFHGAQNDLLSQALAIIAIVIIIFERALFSPALWFLAAALSVYFVLGEWARSDNHKYLQAYWLICIYIALSVRNPTETRTVFYVSATFLLFFTMLFAVIQKTLSDSYLSGAFFEFQLLTDQRFGFWVTTFTDLSHAALLENYEIVDSIEAGRETGAATLNSSTQVEIFAKIITWVNFLDQLAVVVLIALSPWWRFELIKHTLLIIFIFGTYLFAPVIGFGWLIAIWGIASTSENRALIRAGYVFAFIVIESYGLIGSLLTQLMRALMQ